jgi:hypothetical protein
MLPATKHANRDEEYVKLLAQDLVVRLVANRGSLQLLVPNVAKEGELRVFHEFSENDVPTAETLEHHIGTAVLAFLSATHEGSAFQLERYRQAGRDFEASIKPSVEDLLQKGDPDSVFEAAVIRLRGFDHSWSEKEVNEVRTLIEQSAKRGSKQAATFLREKWPVQSDILRKRIRRGSP